VFPPGYDFPWIGNAAFDNSRVTITYNGPGDIGGEDLRNLIKQLCDSTRSAMVGLVYLQRIGLCCDRLTILSKYTSGSVKMHPIIFGDIDKYISDLQKI